MKLYDARVLGLEHASRVIPPAERQRCECCGRRLQLYTDVAWFRVFQESEQRRSQECLQKAKAWTKLEGTIAEPTKLTVWTGKYRGYGSDGRGNVLFCTYACAVRFGQAAYKAGYRIVGKS